MTSAAVRRSMTDATSGMGMFRVSPFVVIPMLVVIGVTPVRGVSRRSHGWVLSMLLVVVVLQQGDATHHGHTGSQRQEEREPVMPMKLHFRQQIGERDEEKGAGGE